MTAIAAPRKPAGSRSEHDWDEIALLAPKLAATMGRYLAQAATFLAPLSVESADNALRLLARWLLDATDVHTIAEISRDDIEDFKVALAQRRGIKGQALAANTQRQRLRMLRMFFERIIEWDWPDAPIRNPIIGGDIPPRPEPLPKFLDDRDAAKLMAAARAASDRRDRLVVEVLARTGLRASELCDLDADTVVRIGDGHRSASPSASSATTASSPSTPTSSCSSPAGAPTTSTTSALTGGSSPTTAAPSTATRSGASSVESPATPA